jgi:hypothetical protein
MLPGPMHVCVIANREKKLKLLGEQRVVIFEFETEERVGLDKGAASGDDFRPALRDQIERSELLEHAHRISGAKQGHGAGQANVFGARRSGS